MEININRQKVFKVAQISLFQLIFTDFGLLKNEESLNWKTQFLCSENTLSRHYETSQLAYIWKYFEILKAKGQDDLQDTKVKINLYRN